MQTVIKNLTTIDHNAMIKTKDHFMLDGTLFSYNNNKQ